MKKENVSEKKHDDVVPQNKGIPKVESADFPVDGKLDADVIIIGGGGAGIPAAVSAFENGAKKIVMLEKRDRVGGNAIMARGIFGCESSVLRQAMVKTDKDEIFRKAIHWHHYDRINGKLLRAYINQSGDTIDWIRKKGIEWKVDTTTRMNYNQDPTWHCVVGGNMAMVMGRLFKEAMENGLQPFFNTQVKEIIMENGKAVGVKADCEGKELIVKAPSIIKSTGFLSNEEKVKNISVYSKRIFRRIYEPNKGEGILFRAGRGQE
jgi:fumarate reductase flavoprotein subunit